MVIDLDHNATTALDERVDAAMRQARDLGNPSSTHARGRAARARHSPGSSSVLPLTRSLRLARS